MLRGSHNFWSRGIVLRSLEHEYQAGIHCGRDNKLTWSNSNTGTPIEKPGTTLQTGLVEGTNTENVANRGTRCRPMKLPLHDPAFLDLTSILPTPLVMSACCGRTRVLTRLRTQMQSMMDLSGTPPTMARMSRGIDDSLGLHRCSTRFNIATAAHTSTACCRSAA